MAKKYLDDEGLRYLWTKIKNKYATQEGLDGKVDKETGKVLSSNDFTDTLKSKLEGIAIGAEVNVQSNWSETDSKSDAFIKNKPSIPTASTTTPKMDGTAAVGSETKWAKGDHVHPSDTSRVPTTRTVNGKALSEDITLKAEDIYINANENVETAIEERIKATDRTLGADEGDFKYDFDVTIGDTIHSDHFYNTNWIDHNFAMASTVLEGKVDKVEGKDLSTNDFTDALKTKLEGIAEGAEVNVQSDWNATSGDAFIKNKPTIPTVGTGTDFPKMDGTKALGTNAGYARVDHVHPSDTSRVPTTRTINGKELSADIELKSDDIIYSENTGFNVTQELKKRIRANSVQQDGKIIGIDFNVTEDASGSSTATTIYTRDGVDYLMGLAQTALNSKVDKVEGKGLSTNDYTDADKTKLDKLVFDGSNKIDSSILPSYVDDVVEAYARSGQTALSSTWLATGSATGTVITPEAGVIYILMADSGDYTANTQFRWAGTTYVKLADGGVSSITNAEIDTIVAS